MESGTLRIRQALSQDAELLWHWANDAIVRQNAFHSGPIPWEDHVKWYHAKLQSAETKIWILEAEGDSVAQIRFDRINPTTAEIDFSVAAAHRGKGLGTKLLRLTAGKACRELGLNNLKAVVFSSNEASKRSFVKAGFQYLKEEVISDVPCSIFIFHCAEISKEKV